jgi:hypothetical protein
MPFAKEFLMVRVTGLLGFAVLLSACTKQESPPAADTATVAATAAAMSLASIAGTWNVNVMREGSDSVATTYVLNTMDTTAWTFTFPNREPIPIRITGMSGDTILSEAGPFESSVRPGVQTRNTIKTWLEADKLVGWVRARYDVTGPDTVIVFRTEGTRQ